MKSQNRNAIGYRRLSDKDQSKYSLEYQDRAIRDYCTHNNLNLINMYTDNGECSDTFDRANYKELENFIKKNKGEASYLIVMHLDRFSRNLPEALRKIDELEDKHHIKVLATNEDINLDTHDPSVFMQRAFNFLQANSELLRIRQRTRDGIRQAQLSGRYINRAPFGYLNATDENGKGILRIDDSRAHIIRVIFDDYLLGMPHFQIYEKAKKMGLTLTGNGIIRVILSTCTYAGLVKVRGDRKSPEKIVKGMHQPIISEADYWLAAEKLSDKRSEKTQPKKAFPLRGIVKCWCGRSMTAGFTKGKSQYYLYYRCISHTSVNYPGERMHQQFEELLDILAFNDQQIKYISDKSKAILKNATCENEKVLLERQKQIKELENKTEKLEMRLMDDEIDAKTYKKWLSKYSMERGTLLKDIEDVLQRGQAAKMSKLTALLPLLKSIKDIYSRATITDKQTLVRAVFKHKLVYSDNKFRTPYVEPYILSNSLKAKEKGLLEIEETPLPESKIWFRTRDEIRTRIPFGATPSRWYVYQFHHPGNSA